MTRGPFRRYIFRRIQIVIVRFFACAILYFLSKKVLKLLLRILKNFVKYIGA